jgi:hypothetical protein
MNAPGRGPRVGSYLLNDLWGSSLQEKPVNCDSVIAERCVNTKRVAALMSDILRRPLRLKPLEIHPLHR